MIVVAECFAQNEHAESGHHELHALSVIDSVIIRLFNHDNVFLLLHGLHLSHLHYLRAR